MNIVTEVTNGPSDNRYVISTEKIENFGLMYWQTKVYKKRLGRFSIMFPPQLVVDGVRDDENVLSQHHRVETFAREAVPSEWDEAWRELTNELREVEIREAGIPGMEPKKDVS